MLTGEIILWENYHSKEGAYQYSLMGMIYYFDQHKLSFYTIEDGNTAIRGANIIQEMDCDGIEVAKI